MKRLNCKIHEPTTSWAFLLATDPLYPPAYANQSLSITNDFPLVALAIENKQTKQTINAKGQPLDPLAVRICSLGCSYPWHSSRREACGKMAELFLRSKSGVGGAYHIGKRK